MGWVLMLLVLVGVTASATPNTSLSGLTMARDKQSVRGGGDSVREAYYAPEQLVCWTEWIRGSHKKRHPHRNPFRRYRLSRKQRRQLRRVLRRMGRITDGNTGFGEKILTASPTEPAAPIGANYPSARWG